MLRSNSTSPDFTAFSEDGLWQEIFEMVANIVYVQGDEVAFFFFKEVNVS